ncbi:MAG: TetR/AcrR family transcriptional regulator [Sneathiella sp.]
MNKKPRGRPRKFREEDVLQTATSVFLENGYDDLTVAALSNHLGLSKPSFYGSFGDKRQLYLQTVDAYATDVGTQMRAAIDKATTLPEAARFYLENAANRYAPKNQQHLGCLIISTMVTVAGADTEMRDWLDQFFSRIDEWLTSNLQQRFEDEIDATGLTAAQISEMIHTTMYSLSMRARAGAARQTLFDLIDTQVDILTRLISANSNKKDP